MNPSTPTHSAGSIGSANSTSAILPASAEVLERSSSNIVRLRRHRRLRTAPSVPPMTSNALEAQSHVTNVNGSPIAWVELGKGPPLMLLHGLGDSNRSWRLAAPLLAKHFRVLMPDLPGHGLSGRPDAPYTLAWYADTLLAWMDAIGIDDTHLCGHSFGGGIAQWMVLADASRVRTLSLVAAGGLGRDVAMGLRLTAFPVLGRLLTPAFMAVGTWAMMRQATGTSFRHEQSEIDRAIWLNRAPGTGRAFHRTVVGCVDLLGQHKQTWQRIGEVPVLPPTCVFWGEDDKIIPLRHCRTARERMRGIRVRTYPKCGHFMHLEVAEKFSRDLRDFLQSPPPSPQLQDAKDSRGSVALGDRFADFARRWVTQVA